MFLQIILVHLLLPLILTLYFKTKTQNNLRPPGPSQLPLIGNLHQFDSRYPHIYLYHLAQKYGPIVSMKFGFRQVVIISSANIIKEIMKSHDLTFSGRPALKSYHKLSYNGQDVAFTTYTTFWREMRKLVTLHLFTTKQLKSSRPIRENEVLLMIEKIANNSNVINLSELMVSMTSNMIYGVAFGKSYGDKGYEESRFFGLFHESQAMFGGFFVSDYLPWLGWIDKISGMNARLEKVFGELDKFYQELIDEHLDVANRPKSMKGDILDILLELWRDGSFSDNLTLNHIKALLMNIITAATDTSAAVIVWAMTALMKNPNVMEKVQAEIRQSVGEKDLINEDDIVKLHYLRAVIKETLRLYPASPLLIARETLQNCTLHRYEIKRGTLVYMNAWAIARDPEIWKNPDDYLPERFLETDIDVKGRDPELIPFGIGRRGCPAMSMGMETVELALANLLYKFNWELPYGMKEENIDFDVLPGITMHKKNALCLVPKPMKF